jgi:hypothetical protein
MNDEELARMAALRGELWRARDALLRAWITAEILATANPTQDMIDPLAQRVADRYNREIAQQK